MSRKTKKIIIILGTVVILAGIYFGSTAIGNRPSTAASTPVVPEANFERLEWFEIVRVEFPGFVFERIGEVWDLVYMDGGIPEGIELDSWQLQMMVFHLSNIQAERTVEQTPEDISVFGFDAPLSWVILTDTAGTTVEYILGDMTPSRLDFFAMQRGDPAIYIVSARNGGLINFSLESLRPRTIFPHFELEDLTQFRMETPGTLIEIIPRLEENLPPQLLFPAAAHILTSPYSLPWGVNPEAFQNILIPFVGLSIEEFINDSPSSLTPYGLDVPRRIFLQTGARTLDLLIGNEVDGMHYAKLADGSGGVFTISGMGNAVNTRPFNLINRFPFLFAIDMVESLTVTGGEIPITASIQGTGLDSIFYLNGMRTEGASFRTFYQALIGLIVDAENPGSPRPPQAADEITIEFLLHSPAGQRASITLIPYNRDFYILEQNGSLEFFVSRNQVRRIFESASAVVFDDAP